VPSGWTQQTESLSAPDDAFELGTAIAIAFCRQLHQRETGETNMMSRKNFFRTMTSQLLRDRVVPSLLTVALAATSACGIDDQQSPEIDSRIDALTVPQKLPRYTRIRDSARAHGVSNAYLLAGIANDETGLAMCWSEATWACKGPASSDCGGGPVIAGASDGPCSAKQGGLGMFQFDAGTYQDTINHYGADVVTIDGQVRDVISYAVNMVKISPYTHNAETDAKALAWINNFNASNSTLRDEWLKTVVRYYNGCEPGWSCWAARYASYSDGLNHAISDPGGLGFWSR
jgi:hypothetical protein